MSLPADPRTPVFDAVRSICPKGVFNDAGNITALHNLLDAFKAPREGQKLHKLANPEAFFKELRKVTGILNQNQVDTISGLLFAGAHWSAGWMAYGIATAWHEARLEPIREKGGAAYLSKYDTGKLADALGNTPAADGDGILYAGRGLVQLTGRKNYAAAGKYLNLDLIKNPDLALQPDVAVKILVWGMETGAFTARKLSSYIGELGTAESFKQARRIINGTDKASQIAGYAETVQDGLLQGGW